MEKKPENIFEYKKWLQEKHNVAVTSQTKTYYESVVNIIKSQIEASSYWLELKSNLIEYNDQYALSTKYPLLSQMDLQLQIKSFDSFLDKTFRINVIHNRNWPDPPNYGWILENNWFTKINDIIRSLIVVKYLDGVDFLLKQFEALCTNCGLESAKRLEARDDGYYAAHFYLKNIVEIPTPEWITIKVPFQVEIQITTQLQEVIRKLLHSYYENKRKMPYSPDQSWKWDYASNEFSATYLGHILHYIEGLIVQTREGQKK